MVKMEAQAMHLGKPILVLLLAIVLSGCGEPQVYSLFAGEEDAFGVGLVERTFRVRVDETVSTRIYLPLAPGTEELARQSFPLVLSLAGGAVSPGQYEWLNVEVASRGFVVLAPSHALDLAIFEQGNGLDVLKSLRRAASRKGDLLEGLIDERPALAMGHSLGGVVATRTWLDGGPQEVSHLILLASLPNPSDDVESRREDQGFVLSLTGERDGRISVDEVAEGAARFAVPTYVAVVEGMNHFQIIDAVTASQWESDQPATISTLDARQRVIDVLDLALQAYADDNDEVLRSPAAWPEGVFAHE